MAEQIRAYRVRSGIRIEPFGDEARDLYVATRTVAEWQSEACAAAGLALVEAPSVEDATERPCLLFSDHVFFTEMALRNFVADALGSSGIRALAMPESPAVHALSPLSDAREGPGGARVFDVFWLPEGAAIGPRQELAALAEPLVQTLRERRLELRLPRAESGPDAAVAPLTARVVGHIRHWIHLLRLSQLSVGVLLLDRLRGEPLRMVRLSLARRRPWAMGPMLNFVHPSARVHPKADLEAAIVGPQCVIRAHAHVHGSVLGEGVDIGDHAAVMGCTLARGVQVLRASYLAHCAAMPNATLANYKVQLSLFGREVFLTSSARLLDAKLQGDVRVFDGRAFVGIGSAFLGACLGHRVALGADVTIASGRAIPNGVTIVGSSDRVVANVGDHPEGTRLTLVDGRMVPVSSGPTPAPAAREP